MLLLPPILPNVPLWSWQQRDTFLLDPVAIDMLELFFDLTVKRHFQLPASYLVCAMEQNGDIDSSYLPELILIIPDVKRHTTGYIQFQIGKPRWEIEKEIYRMTPPFPTLTSSSLPPSTSLSSSTSPSPHSRSNSSRSRRENDPNDTSNKQFDKIGLGVSILLTQIRRSAIRSKWFERRLTPPDAQLIQKKEHMAAIKFLRFLSDTDMNAISSGEKIGLDEEGGKGILFRLAHKPLPSIEFSPNKQEKKNNSILTLVEQSNTPPLPLEQFLFLTKMFSININRYAAVLATVLICIIFIHIIVLFFTTVIYICQIGYDHYHKYHRQYQTLSKSTQIQIHPNRMTKIIEKEEKKKMKNLEQKSIIAIHNINEKQDCDN